MKKRSVVRWMQKKGLPLAKKIVLVAVLDFICYTVLAQFVAAGIVDRYYSRFVGNFLASVVATVVWVLWFHWFYTTTTYKVWCLGVKRGAMFDWKKEAKDFFKSEGISFLMVYSVFIAIFEGAVLWVTLFNTRMHWSLAYIYGFLFPFRIADDKLNLFLSPFLSVAVLLLLILCFALLGRRRLHRKIQKM